MASIKPHKDGWRAQLYVAGVRDSKVLRTQREAKAWASARETELRQRKDAQPADLHTVRDMLTRYEKEVSSEKQGARHERPMLDMKRQAPLQPRHFFCQFGKFFAH